MNKMVLSIKSRIKYINRSQCIEKQSPRFLAPESDFVEGNFSTSGGGAGGGGFGMIQAHTFTVPFTSIIIFTSAPPQIIRHYILGPLA